MVDAPPPTAGRGEIRVRGLASGLEYTDVLIRRHLYPQTMHRRPPFVIGYDVVGEIDQLGDGERLSSWRPGGRYDCGRVERCLSHAPGQPPEISVPALQCAQLGVLQLLVAPQRGQGPRRSPSTSRQAAAAEA